MADLPAWLQRDDDEALRFENAAAKRLTAHLRDLFTQAMREVAAEYVQLAGGLDVPLDVPMSQQLRSTLIRSLLALSTGFTSELPRLLAGLRDLILRALGLGVAQAGRLFEQAPPVSPLASTVLLAAPDRLALAIPERITSALVLAQNMPLVRWADATTALAVANRAVTQAEQTTRWVTNRAIAEGSTAVAELAGVGRMWVAERDACLSCRAYSGEVAPAGQPFPAGLTFGDKPIGTEAPWGPPLHPRCRCSVKPYIGRAGSVDITLALKREAQRSVLRGDSAHDSRPARLRAAQRLLDTGLIGTSETAKKRARRAVEAGAFPDRRGTRRAKTSPRRAPTLEIDS